MTLIADCIPFNPAALVSYLVNPGQGAAPGHGWSSVPAVTCVPPAPTGLIECITGGADLECCYVAGIDGCIMLIDGEPVKLS